MDRIIHAELTRIGLRLRMSPEELSFMAVLGADGLLKFRQWLDAAIINRHHRLYESLSNMSRLTPAGLSAKIAEHAFGPVLTAGITYYMSTDRALSTMEKLPADFLAETLEHMEPSRIPELINRTGPEATRKVARGLLNRESWITLGGMVDYMNGDMIKIALEEFDNAEQVLRSAVYVRDTGRISEFAEHFSDDRLEELIHIAHRNQLWVEALEITSHLDQQTLTRLAQVVARQDDELLLDMGRAATEHGLWPVAMRVIARQEHTALERVASMTEQDPDSLIRGIIATMDQDELQPMLGRLTGLLDESQRERVKVLATAEGSEQHLSAIGL